MGFEILYYRENGFNQWWSKWDLSCQKKGRRNGERNLDPFCCLCKLEERCQREGKHTSMCLFCKHLKDFLYHSVCTTPLYFMGINFYTLLIDANTPFFCILDGVFAKKSLERSVCIN